MKAHPRKDISTALRNAAIARSEGRKFYGFGDWLVRGLVTNQWMAGRPMPRLMGMMERLP